MPALITHYSFGKAVFADAARYFELTTTDEKDAFYIGQQGPDPLFFLVLNPAMSKWAKMGSLMHHVRTPELIAAFFEAARRLDGRERKIALAYAAGFAGHWQLDSIAHPFVYWWQHGLCAAGIEGLDDHAASKVHAEVERDLDEAILYRTQGKTIERFRPTRVLRASSTVLSVVDKLYFYVMLWVYDRPIDPRAYSQALRCFRLCMNALYSPSGKKRMAVSLLERVLTKDAYSLMAALSHHVRSSYTSDFDNHEHKLWHDPETQSPSYASFWDLFEDARQHMVEHFPLLSTHPLDASQLEGVVMRNFEGLTPEPLLDSSW